MTLEDPAEKGFTTDQDDLTDVAEVDEHAIDSLSPEPQLATVIAEPAEAVIVNHGPDLSVLDVRPLPGSPRDYRFPAFERATLSNGMTVVQAHVSGRALLAAQLLLPGGGWSELADRGGVSVLTARALVEGTRRRAAVELIEAAERLGAEIHADASWETLNATVEVPRSRFGAALALLAEMVAEPAFPGEEVDRLRDERMNDLLQAWADPRRRSERVFPETIFGPVSPYRRPLAGTQTTVRALDRDALAERHAQMLDPSSMTLIVAGDLTGLPVVEWAEEHLGSIPPAGEPTATSAAAETSAPAGRRIVVVDRPGSPQSELRVGHVGVSRRTPDFHAIAVLNAILGGTFGSRLNRLIREERGYSYGISSAFEMRRSPGPFVVRTAVQTEVTVPALLDTLHVLREIGAAEVEPAEIELARDYLVGVFPLRFETAGQVAAALAGLVVFDLPDDELDRYRPSVAAIGQGDVLDAARRHVRPDDASIVIVGDARKFDTALRGARLGEVTLVPADATAE